MPDPGPHLGLNHADVHPGLPAADHLVPLAGLGERHRAVVGMPADVGEMV